MRRARVVAERPASGGVSLVSASGNRGSRSRRGTAIAAVFYTVLETAKLAAIDPAKYLREAALADDRGRPLLPTE
jgi:transposase